MPTLSLSAGRLHYVEQGEGPPLLLLHGWPTHAGLYRHVLPTVARTRRAIALDLFGFGQSDKPTDVSYSFRFWDQVLDEATEALGIEQTGLVVHDLGGPIGLHWAVRRVPRIRELVLLNTLVFPEMSPAVVAFVAGTKLPGLRHLLRSDPGIHWAMRFGVQRKQAIDVGLYSAPYRSRADRKALVKTGHALHPKGFETIADGIGAFTCPTLLAWGTEDRILPQVSHTMARVKARLPHAQMHPIPDCGHFLQEDRPEALAEAFAAFFA